MLHGVGLECDAPELEGELGAECADGGEAFVAEALLHLGDVELPVARLAVVRGNVGVTSTNSDGNQS